MKLDLNRLLTDTEDRLNPGERICPHMSRYEPHQGAMDKEPSLIAFTVLCVGEQCGRWRSCKNIHMHEDEKVKIFGANYPIGPL
jgi:hypothetical protein